MESKCICIVFLLSVTSFQVTPHPTLKTEDFSHVMPSREKRMAPELKENAATFWTTGAQATLRSRLAVEPVKTRARNVVLFVGDGMSIPTLVAARIFKGQAEGHSGEEQSLSFERFPYTGLAKTYCVNAQVGESACTATALLAGVKTNEGAIGVSADTQGTSNEVAGIVTWAQAAGMRTGVVTTTRVTHATPAGAYAHVEYRDWECDADLDADAAASGTWDIARQLVSADPGKSINVVLGGGRREFRPSGQLDEDGSNVGYRADGVDLVETWKKDKKAAGKNASYVFNKKGLLGVNVNTTEFLLGLFDSSHLPYHLESDQATVPTLSEMVETAIKVLQKGPNGFFLLVEGGRIDHAHHDNMAHLALDETVQMSLAVETVLRMTNARDTLVVVTADHAHTMTMSGYANRGESIFSKAGTATDDLPYATLSYANGPGHKMCGTERCNLDDDDMESPEYEFPSTAPLDSETHGGDDVAVFATGPWAHLFTGAYEQNYIPHALAYAACLGKDRPPFCNAPLAKAAAKPVGTGAKATVPVGTGAKATVPIGTGAKATMPVGTAAKP